MSRLMIQLGVSAELVNSIASLYRKVVVKIDNNDKGTQSTLGVIQGCPLSPTLFGLVVDHLYWRMEEQDIGVQLGTHKIKMLLFADDVELVAADADEMRRHIANLEDFCVEARMKVNLLKTKWLCVGGRTQEVFQFRGEVVEECKGYKYLGVELAANLSWSQCLQSRVCNGLKSLFSLWGKCENIKLFSWPLRSRLFDAVVRPVLLYEFVIGSIGVSVYLVFDCRELVVVKIELGLVLVLFTIRVLVAEFDFCGRFVEIRWGYLLWKAHLD
ncbi:hypothetical protein R1sor_010462 [Riccia sorocarpa]|uniref:Reverse transcriptase domain-containing protein n=1 Tax=Riccia sorocarpa TaxID=122646 RepID=A0ABD3I264_9MARC